ncbi:MAG: SdiA-regulated domain-containing protein [Gemmatimonadota bacterium]
MNRVLRPGVALALVAITVGCRAETRQTARSIDSSEIARRETRLDQSLAANGGAVPSDSALARWILPTSLNEISGLALTTDGRLFTHGDERAVISQVDYRKGEVIKQFQLGKRVVKGDFEGITIVGDIMFMLTSTGKLYEFREGGNGDRVDYSIHDTELGHECEFEGIAYDKSINSLLLSCKNVGTKRMQDSLVIYRWNLSETGRNRISHISGNPAAIVQENDWKGLHPSDITVDPISGNYVLVSSQESALIWVKPDGTVLSARPLPGGHDQAEGLAITQDSILIVSDEAGKRPAVITLYRWH